MAKKPGLPDGNLELEVDDAAFAEPAHVEDYLDRTFASPQPPRVAQLPAARPRPKVVERPAEKPPERDLKVQEERGRQGKPERRSPPPTRRPERRELSIDAETSRMIDRVLSDLQEKTPQRDVTASEFARAILQLADESRHHQDFSHVNRRGQWGSPTARAFVSDIKKAFLRAIGRHFMEQHPQEALEFCRELHGEEQLS